MPAKFWGEEVSTAVFILNRAPTKALKGKTQFKAWHGRKPNVSFLRTFGCVGHVKNTKPHLGKLEDRSTPMVLLGYEEGSKAYRLYDPKGGKVVVSRDVVFDEMAAWDWEDQGTREAAGFSSTFAVEHLVIQGGDDGAEEQAAAGEQSPPAAAHLPPPQSPAMAGQGTPPLEFASPPTDIDEFVDAFHDGEKVRFRRVDNLVGEGGAPGLASRLLDDLELPLSVQRSRRCSQWLNVTSIGAGRCWRR